MRAKWEGGQVGDDVHLNLYGRCPIGATLPNRLKLLRWGQTPLHWRHLRSSPEGSSTTYTESILVGLRSMIAPLPCVKTCRITGATVEHREGERERKVYLYRKGRHGRAPYWLVECGLEIPICIDTARGAIIEEMLVMKMWCHGGSQISTG